MAQTPSRVNITVPARLLLEVAGSGVQQHIADIELPIVVLVGPGETGTGPTVQVAPIQDVSIDRGPHVQVGEHTIMAARDLAPGVEGRLINSDGTLGDTVRGLADGIWTEVTQSPKEEGMLGHEPVRSTDGWSMSGKAAQCPNHRMHGPHMWGQIEGDPSPEEVMARQVKVNHYHCAGA